MFNAKEILVSNWDGRYLINLKNDKGKGKITGPIGITIWRQVAQKKRKGRTQN